MKFVSLLFVVLFSFSQNYGQKVKLPEIAFLFEDQVINIDSITFKSFLVVDTAMIHWYGQEFKFRNARLLGNSPSYKALIDLLNPSLQDSISAHDNGLNFDLELITPSYDSCLNYIKSKVNFRKIYDEYNEPGLDFILYPKLRDSLAILIPQILGCGIYERDQYREIEELNLTLNSIIKQNLPLSRDSLMRLISLTHRIITETTGNCGADDEVDTYSFASYNQMGFEILKQAIKGNIHGVSVVVHTLNDKKEPVNCIDVYYCPIWAESDIQLVSSLESPVEFSIPIADYYFWAGGEKIDFHTLSYNDYVEVNIRPQAKPITIVLRCIEK